MRESYRSGGDYDDVAVEEVEGKVEILRICDIIKSVLEKK